MTDPQILQLAASVLTPEQYQAWELWERGLGYKNIGTKLGISTSSARDRIHRAIARLEPHLEDAA